MSGTISPTAAYVDATGIHAPTYADIVAYLNSAFQTIYGADIVTDPATQDGQLIGIFALAIADTNSACIAVYNSFSPSTAQGVGLSSNVKINGIARLTPSFGQVDLVITGIAGTEIVNGVAEDGASTPWDLPASVIIPFGGQITVRATADPPGDVPALPNTINRIRTPTYGWQTVNNPGAASPGAPVETDAGLRERQSVSTALPSSTVLDGVVGAVAGLSGVIDYRGYENDTSIDYTVMPPPVGEWPLPPHSICMVVAGGDPIAICQTILNKKTLGCFTYGDIRESVTDIYGIPHDIGFFIPTQVPIQVGIGITPLPGYSTTIGQAMSAAVAAYINALRIGDDVLYSKLFLPANLCDATTGLPIGAVGTFDITEMAVNGGTANIPIAFNQKAACDPLTGVTIVVNA